VRLTEYINRDFELLRKRIADVSSAYDHQDPEVTMVKAKAMFDAFYRRFEIEDFLFSKLPPTHETRVLIKTYLKKRLQLSNQLDDMLMLHVSEPDFMTHVRALIIMSKEHQEYSEQEFLPNVIKHLSVSESNNLSNALEDRLHNTPASIAS
jgi:hypothetical protein